MFYSITGKLVHLDNDFVAVDCSGVAYKCFVSTNTKSNLKNIGEEVKLYTYLSVREDAMDLYGFYDKSELSCFKLLISVSGVGLKMAIALLSALKAEQIATAVATEDFKTLTIASGVGPKLAKRIVLELKDKLKKSSPSQNLKTNVNTVNGTNGVSNTFKAISALEVLGFSKADILPIISKFDANLEVEVLIKLSLKELSKGV